MERLRRRLDENKISLNEDVRKAELAEDKLRKETRAKERLARQDPDAKVYRVTLDTVDKPNLQLIINPAKIAAADGQTSPESAGDPETDAGEADGGRDAAVDPMRDEALNILADVVGSLPRTQDREHDAVAFDREHLRCQRASPGG